MKLKFNELEYLKKYKTSDNFLSFFKGFEGALIGNEEETIAEKGLVKEGHKSPFMTRVMGPLDDPEASVRVAIQISDTLIEKLCYRKGDDVVLLENHGDELNVSTPFSWDLTIAEIAEIIPMSASVMSMVEGSFNPFEVAMILLLIDLQRKQVALDYWGEDSKAMHSFDEMMAFKNQLPTGSLLKLASAQYGIPLPNESESMTIIEALVKKGVVSLKEGYKLEGEYEALGATFGQLQYLTLVEMFNKVGEDLKSAAFVVLSGGQNSHLWMDITGDVRLLKSISGNYLLKTLEEVFECPKLD